MKTFQTQTSFSIIHSLFVKILLFLLIFLTAANLKAQQEIQSPGLPLWSSVAAVAGSGTAQAQTATFNAQAVQGGLQNGLQLCWLPAAANTATAPTFSPNSLTAHTIVKVPNNAALVANDLITTQWACARYNTTGTHWELQNPATAPSSGGGVSFPACPAYTGSSTVDFSSFTCGVVTASGANPTLTFTTPTSNAATPLTLILCNDGVSRTWTLPSTAKQIVTPIVPSTCVFNTAIIFDVNSGNYNGPGSNDTASIINFTSERPTPTVVGPGGAAFVNSTDHLFHHLNSSLLDQAMVKIGQDVNNATGQVTSSHFSSGLPRNQGGLGTSSASTGLLRDGSPATASELSGDVVTSGSNSSLVKGVNGTPLCTGFTPTNGQALQLTTGGSPNPCWTAALPAGSFPACHPYTYTTGTLAVDFSSFTCAIVTASGANPTLSFTAPTGATPLTLVLCNDTTARVWTLPGTAKQISAPINLSTCIFNNSIVYDVNSGNYNGPGSNDTPSIINFTSERSLPTVLAPGGAISPNSSDHNAHYTNSTGVDFATFATGHDCNPTTGVCTKVNGITISGTPAVGSIPVATSSSAAAWTAKDARIADIYVGDTSASSALVDAQLGPQKHGVKIPFDSTILEIDIESDAGSPNVIVGRGRCTTFTSGTCSAETNVNLLSSALASSSGFGKCSNTGGTTGLDGGTTCASTLQNTTVLKGDWIYLVSGTAGGTAKSVTIHIWYR